jgi:hypothetical protein
LGVKDFAVESTFTVLLKDTNPKIANPGNLFQGTATMTYSAELERFGQ